MWWVTSQEHHTLSAVLIMARMMIRARLVMMVSTCRVEMSVMAGQ